MSRDQTSNSGETRRAGSIASRICAVIVTYNPDSDVPDRARLVSSQVGAVIVIDNGSGPDFENAFRRLTQIPDLTLLRNDTNVGLATALNQGVDWAKDRGFEWALLFDQDSTPFDGMVEELARITQELGQQASTTLLGSNFVDVNSGRAWLNPLEYANRSWAHVKTMTTSGTLVPLSVFEALGPFRSDLFVDLVDMEYSLRARSQGYRVVASVRPLMLHTVGAKQRRRFLWRTVWPSYHAPLRRYYMARSLGLLVREYGPNNPKWALTEILAHVKSLVLVLLYEDNRLSKLAFTARGIIAGLRRGTVNGSIEPRTTRMMEHAPRHPGE